MSDEGEGQGPQGMMGQGWQKGQRAKCGKGLKRQGGKGTRAIIIAQRLISEALRLVERSAPSTSVSPLLLTSPLLSSPPLLPSLLYNTLCRSSLYCCESPPCVAPLLRTAFVSAPCNIAVRPPMCLFIAYSLLPPHSVLSRVLPQWGPSLRIVSASALWIVVGPPLCVPLLRVAAPSALCYP